MKKYKTNKFKSYFDALQLWSSRLHLAPNSFNYYTDFIRNHDEICAMEKILNQQILYIQKCKIVLYQNAYKRKIILFKIYDKKIKKSN